MFWPTPTLLPPFCNEELRKSNGEFQVVPGPSGDIPNLEFSVTDLSFSVTDSSFSVTFRVSNLCRIEGSGNGGAFGRLTRNRVSN
jgi:hypothetical protein